MRKALASVAVIIFAGLLCTSLLAVFHQSVAKTYCAKSQLPEHAYFMAY